MKEYTKKIIFISLLAFLAIGERLWWDLGPNVELITTAVIMASLLLGRFWAIAAGLLILSLTDLKLGNSNLMLFTWSAFVFEALIISGLGNKIKFFKQKFIKRLFISSTMGIGMSLWFYLWTNFGVWFLASWGMYPKTFIGLLACYLAGLPFLKLNLLSNLFFIPASLLIWQLISSKSYFFSFWSLKTVNKEK